MSTVGIFPGTKLSGLSGILVSGHHSSLQPDEEKILGTILLLTSFDKVVSSSPLNICFSVYSYNSL